jgi:capsule polysaccharide export protein KpsC/LpsZ
MIVANQPQTRNVVETMIHYDLDAMFTFTVGMGFTALVMACEVLAIAIKAWAAKRQVPQPAPFRLPA